MSLTRYMYTVYKYKNKNRVYKTQYKIYSTERRFLKNLMAVVSPVYSNFWLINAQVATNANFSQTRENLQN